MPLASKKCLRGNSSTLPEVSKFLIQSKLEFSTRNRIDCSTENVLRSFLVFFLSPDKDIVIRRILHFSNARKFLLYIFIIVLIIRNALFIINNDVFLNMIWNAEFAFIITANISFFSFVIHCFINFQDVKVSLHFVLWIRFYWKHDKYIVVIYYVQ